MTLKFECRYLFLLHVKDERNRIEFLFTELMCKIDLWSQHGHQVLFFSFIVFRKLTALTQFCCFCMVHLKTNFLITQSSGHICNSFIWGKHHLLCKLHKNTSNSFQRYCFFNTIAQPISFCNWKTCSVHLFYWNDSILT